MALEECLPGVVPIVATMTTGDEQPRPPMGRAQSTVSFAATTINHRGDRGNHGNRSDNEDNEDNHSSTCSTDDVLPDEEEMPLVEESRTRVFSVSADRPITRIPTRVDMKTLTHKAKRPAVDIEFHDLTYAVNTTAGELIAIKYITRIGIGPADICLAVEGGWQVR